MAEQHPTIDGVTVEFTPNPYGAYRFDIRVLALTCASGPTAYIRAWNNPGWGTVINTSDLNIRAEHAETVIAMIRDQVEWLKEQEAANE